MSNPSYPLWADPSDPLGDKADDPVRLAEEGRSADSASELGSEVGEASDDDDVAADVAAQIIGVEAVEAAARLRQQEVSSSS